MVNDDGRRRTPDHGHPISSPCEPNGSGELGSGELIKILKTVFSHHRTFNRVLENVALKFVKTGPYCLPKS